MPDTVKIKAVVVDLDKTLLHTDKTLSEYTVKVLDECKKHKIRIMVATARPYRTAKKYAQLINADAMVVSNGGRIVYSDRQTDYGIKPETAVHLINALQQHPDIRITVETGDCAYSNYPVSNYETVISDNLADIAVKEGTLKILVHLDREETLSWVIKELTGDVYYTVAHGYLLQIMDSAATKWNGIKAMLDICGCIPEETVYFGDDQDDIEPLKMCGLGVAVANGIDAVKCVADYIAQPNDSDGVAEFIENYILKNL